MMEWIRHPWVVTHGCVMPPRWPWVDTHGRRGLSPMVVLCHRDAVHMAGDTVTVGYHPRLWYITATRFCVLPPQWPWVITHGCVMPPLQGSVLLFHLPWVTRTLCASPTAVLYHRDAVLCYSTAMRFIW